MRRLIIPIALALAGFLHAEQAPGDVDWDAETKALLEKAVSDDPFVAIPAQDEIRETGRPCAPALRAALKDTRSHVRFFAAELLGEIRDSAAVPDLLPLLDDLVTDKTGEPVAAAAARALGRLGDPSAADKLIEKLDSTSIDVRFEAARSLGTLRVRRAEAKLLEILKKREVATTFRGGLMPAAAMESLGKIRAQSALKDIVDMLDALTPDELTGMSYDQIAMKALERISGESKGSVEADKKEETKRQWREWWAKQAPSEVPK
ncbi:MAG: HEAT repeat domain-containing protein [Candidatus Brocadiae bacterium]|nr:HEAT repeat domain-containing protein [Candidatus Brocadiia bacterium]